MLDVSFKKFILCTTHDHVRGYLFEKSKKCKKKHHRTNNIFPPYNVVQNDDAKRWENTIFSHL